MLVDLLDEDFAEQTDLVVHALNGIGSVFELQGPTPKNDFCRMFIREGLLDPLASALLNVMATPGESASDMKSKIIQILLIFSQVSQSDGNVRTALGTRKIIRRECMYKYQDSKLIVVLRAAARLRVTRPRTLGSPSESYQAPLNERWDAGCPSKCERHRDPRADTRRTKRWKTQSRK